MLPYWVTKNGSPVKSFIDELDAIDWIEAEERRWKEQGFDVPEFKIWFGAEEISRYYGGVQSNLCPQGQNKS